MNKEYNLGLKTYYYTVYLYPKRFGSRWIKKLHWKGYTIDQFSKWKWYFKYRAALLKVQNPKFYVEEIWGAENAIGPSKEFLEKKNLKNKISTSRRMITKLSNSISSYEEAQNKKLFPDFENKNYQKAILKLDNYKNQLKKLLNE